MIVPVEVPTGLSGKAVIDEASVEGGGAAIAKAKLKTALGLPAWKLSGISVPTNVKPEGEDQIHVAALNIGGAATHGPVTITDVLPEGLTVTGSNRPRPAAAARRWDRSSPARSARPFPPAQCSSP